MESHTTFKKYFHIIEHDVRLANHDWQIRFSYPSRWRNSWSLEILRDGRQVYITRSNTSPLKPLGILRVAIAWCRHYEAS